MQLAKMPAVRVCWCPQSVRIMGTKHDNGARNFPSVERFFCVYVSARKSIADRAI
jgi:hypothetical protein